MELFTVAEIVALVLNGFFNKTGQIIAEESFKQLKERLSQKSPETLKQLQSAPEGDAEALREPIEVIATLMEEDTTFKQLAEKVAKENADKHRQVIKNMTNFGFNAETGSNVSNITLNQTFN
ncbi:hypothetical protein PCC7424_2875 [Gloeothece citriformis PCC 7424]|uniref:Uncharacterized protein n=1 Tax=Gloeothece citriformis (strain PCC 7424) TaxID=65393 RepID=B7K8T2_GLOC7|nr:hypothetical protein [Gloeothece citriformis]ACK71280.1 hypothetical protein PCC7424_2875 [Gloeothece citriformis PCC 7424]